MININYREDMERCILEIEQNIKEDLDVGKIAEMMGYSLYHFSRVFNLCQGMTVMEYVRKRRLSLAANELFHGRKIIDIASDYGFDTQSGFAKAFRKEYGFSPTQYVRRMVGFHSESSILKLGGYMMNCKILKSSAFKVAGYGIHSNVVNSGYTKDVASFWDQYEGEQMEGKLYRLLQPPKHAEVGMCVPTSQDGSVSYLLGVIVEDFSKVTEDMITVEIPEAEYAVFTTLPVDGTKDTDESEFAQMIKLTWKYIFEEWFPNSDYEYDDEKYDFEYYDERCHARPDTVMDIYVPVKKK